jgi:hypothetical protein
MIAEYGLLTLAILFIAVLEDSKAVGVLFMILMPILFVATPVLGILSLIQIRKSKGLLYGKLRVAIAIIMSILITYYTYCPQECRFCKLIGEKQSFVSVQNLEIQKKAR